MTVMIGNCVSQTALRLTVVTLALASTACGDFADALDNSIGSQTFGPDLDKDAVCPNSETPDGCGVIDIVNDERASQSLPPVRFDPSLARAARAHATDMAEKNYFAHESPDGRDFVDRTSEASYQGFATGENIAEGQRSAEEVMVSWMNSPGHRRNILAENSNELGVGFDEGFWVQVFGQHD